MADNRYMNSSAAEAAQVDLGLRSYMLGIYNYMTSALLVSGLFAFGTKMLATVEGPAGQVFLTPFGSLLFNSPFRFVLMFAPFVFVFWIGARLNSMSVSRAQTLFFVFAAVMGMSLASILIVFNMPSVARAFFVTAGAFAGLSLYGYTTKRNLSAFGAFLTIGVIGLFLAIIVNMFVGSSTLQLAISVIGVLIFGGLTAYDTQRLKLMYYAGDSAAMLAKKSIYGALSLYINFINMFVFMLQLFGNRE